MVDTKFAGRGVDLERGDGVSPTEGFDRVANVLSVGEAGSSRALIDASAHGDDWMDFVLGQQEGDEVPVVIELNPADTGHGDIVTDYDNAACRNWRLRHDDSGFLVGFPALITKLSRGGERAGLLQMSLTLKILNPGVTDVDES